MSDIDHEQRPSQPVRGRSQSRNGPDTRDDGAGAPGRGPASDFVIAEGPAADPIVHRVRGGIVFAVGAVATFLLMSNEDQLERGALIGMGSVLVTTIGLLDLLGLLASSARPRSELEAAVDLRALWLRCLDGEKWWMAPRVTFPAALASFTAVALVGGVAALPIAILVALLPLALSAIRRPMLLVGVVGTAIILPFLGVYGLWDPWETHYGEVAREILARDDWISLWWAQEDWFWSKPILIFWLEAIAMSALGIDFRPDAHPAHPEWALRLPHFLLALGALLAVYVLIQRAFGRRAGVVAALVLCTMPYFFFLSHQAITDMPFVATMTMAMCMFGLAILERPDREVRLYKLGPIVLSAQHALFGAVSMAAIPQIILLATRNVTLVTGGFAWHRDRFWFGSAGNAGNPGNAEMREVTPVFDDLVAQPMAQALVWLVGFAFLASVLRRERRAQSLYMFAFYFFCALSFMAKGIPGFALPGLVALLWLIATRRWDLLLEGKLRVAIGIVIVMTIGMPWYVAMYIRHGQGFTDRLLVHDHINRLAAGVHGDTGSVEYFLEQLGVGLFPWIAFAPMAIAVWAVWGPRRAASASTRDVPEAATREVPRADRGTAPAPEPDERGEASPADTGERKAAQQTRGQPDRAGESLDGGPALAPPAAAPRFADPDARTAAAQREVLTLIGLWGTAAFVLFSAMVTKFHHYIFPAVPACGMLAGITLDRLFGPANDLEQMTWRGVGGTLLAALAPTPLVIGIAGFWGDVRGVAPRDVPPGETRDWVLSHPWDPAFCLAWIALGIALAAAAWWMLRGPAPEPGEVGTEASPRWLGAAATSGLFAAPAVVGLVGRDLSWVTSSRPYGYERLIHLFVYNYGRPWPDQFDYRPVLTGFAILAGVTIGVAAFPIVRQVALRAFLGLALAFAVWCLDVYMIDLSPHWGQRELVDRYYEARGGPDEPLIAWQMNWKGENFYTGNRVYAFVDLDNRRLQEWVRAHPGRRTWFLLEHSRLASLRSVLRGALIEPITDERLNNKFVLVRVDLPR
jgi:4-amino-4-deoxy-L-arabinose transferase-like glycosyltransferase